MSEKDILLRLQSKVLRIIFDCKRSGDAWPGLWIHNNNQIDSIQDLYYDVIKKLCTKHQWRNVTIWCPLLIFCRPHKFFAVSKKKKKGRHFFFRFFL